jgi:hypothetical protein
VAEKWQNLIDFKTQVDFETYQRQIETLFLNKTVLYQLAFDFYDSNIDEKISKMDLYKVF